MGEVNESFHELETTIKWISLMAGPLAIAWLAFSTEGFIRWVSIISLLLFLANFYYKFKYKHSYSEHVINGVTILGLILSFYND
ncbi:hypothetical protein QUF95_06835 [Paenibacillus silvae]|uniref:hypothetical protein n=1 Tax=Paenibacillus silvae TaxID=1325358 RepID=UPI0025A19D69|nr:hypothetical protein [Paenibacillus silvae]MDM5277090.1 hypothetical protein [Paenibacillus silvae]